MIEKGPDYDKAMQQALRYLSYRPRSEAEMRRKLSPQFLTNIVAQTIARLKGMSYIDDGSFARSWVQNRSEHRPRASRLVRQELLSKGVKREVIEEAISSLDDEAAALKLGAKLSSSLTGADYSLFRRKLWGYLQRRGFSVSVVRATVERLWNEATGNVAKNG